MKFANEINIFLFFGLFYLNDAFGGCYYPFCKNPLSSEEISSICLDKLEPWACQEMGARYENGYGGTPIDLVSAAYFLEKSCEFSKESYDCSPIQHAYLRGEWQGSTISAPNLKKALYYFEYACEKFHPIEKQDCMVAGAFHTNGIEVEGIPQDQKKALRFFQMSCNEDELKNDNATGCWELARFYREGIEIPKDEPKALHLTQYACSLGSDKACRFLKKKKPNKK